MRLFQASNSRFKCAFFRPLLTPLSTAPSPPPSQFTVCTSRFARCRGLCFFSPVGVRLVPLKTHDFRRERHSRYLVTRGAPREAEQQAKVGSVSTSWDSASNCEAALSGEALSLAMQPAVRREIEHKLMISRDFDRILTGFEPDFNRI